ncbi:ankyrin repeat-containing protein [Plakobranchus ocellatus]|uniref:Ankyrin repeat-containing protein n=1 Tax=Plakobranchus ocellatus TaxID=259542 RepID=A0AAV3Y388_9GAST|nr:ankyrin repeat-containing protein [Plakobranchus ocellatus]
MRLTCIKKYGADIAAVDEEGNSALHMMVKGFGKVQEETLRLFVFQCNEINMHGMAFLILAAQRRHTKVVRILMELGSDPIIVNFTMAQPHTTVSVALDRRDKYFEDLHLACAEELVTQCD